MLYRKIRKLLPVCHCLSTLPGGLCWIYSGVMWRLMGGKQGVISNTSGAQKSCCCRPDIPHRECYCLCLQISFLILYLKNLIPLLWIHWLWPCCKIHSFQKHACWHSPFRPHQHPRSPPRSKVPSGILRGVFTNTSVQSYDNMRQLDLKRSTLLSSGDSFLTQAAFRDKYIQATFSLYFQLRAFQLCL